MSQVMRSKVQEVYIANDKGRKAKGVSVTGRSHVPKCPSAAPCEPSGGYDV
jgi:hypothetical protein